MVRTARTQFESPRSEVEIHPLSIRMTKGIVRRDGDGERSAVDVQNSQWSRESRLKDSDPKAAAHVLLRVGQVMAERMASGPVIESADEES